MDAVEVVVTGRVQGVFFRASAADEARRLGVRGWVRNEPDGSVRVHLEGDPDDVAAMVAWCRNGPAYARVAGVRTKPVEPDGAAGFEVRD
jgi:acylphosphatase